MYNDMTAIAQVLVSRGFLTDQIFCLHGRLDRPLVLYIRAGRQPPGRGVGAMARSFCTSAAMASSPGKLRQKHEPVCCSLPPAGHAQPRLGWLTMITCSGTTFLRRWRCRSGSRSRSCPTSDTRTYWRTVCPPTPSRWR